MTWGLLMLVRDVKQRYVEADDKLLKDGGFPRCFENRSQFICWVQAARLAQPRPGNSWCEDCTPLYKEKMIAARRCDHPGVTFDADGDGVRPGLPFGSDRK